MSHHYFSLVGQGHLRVQAPIQNRTCPIKAYGFSLYIHLLSVVQTDFDFGFNQMKCSQ